MGKKNTVTQKQIDKIIKNSEVDVKTMGDKTTVVLVTLPNGFQIVESSSCVDPANYDAKLGAEICMKRVEDKIWELEGYWLQKLIYIENTGNL